LLKILRAAWKIDEIKEKILFTLFIILLYRIGNAVPVPYVDTAKLAQYFSSMSNTVLGLWNTMSGGAFSQATYLLSVFSLISTLLSLSNFLP